MKLKLFLDTNVIIDVIARREPFFEDSCEVLSLCETGKAEGFASAITFCTISYVLRKYATGDTLKRHLRALRDTLPPVDLTAALLDLKTGTKRSEIFASLHVQMVWEQKTFCCRERKTRSNLLRSFLTP